MKTVSEKNKKGAKLVKVSAFVITAMRYILIKIFLFCVLARTARYTHIVLLADVGSYTGE